MKFEDIKVGDGTFVSLTKLIGKNIKDIEGQLCNDFGQINFKLFRIVFDDETDMYVEGEHDFPYITESGNPQPNFDNETLQTLYDDEKSEENS